MSLDNLVLVNLISEQVIPAVLPMYHIQGITKLVHLITNDGFKDTSLRVFQFYSKKMREFTNQGNKISNGVSMQDVLVKYNDWHSTYGATLMVYEEHPQMLINLTGGTKLMAIGAYRAALEKQIPAFYIDSGSNQWIWVISASSSDYFQIESISGEMGIKELVELHGGNIRHDMQKMKGYNEHLFQLASSIARVHWIMKGVTAFNQEHLYHREILVGDAKVMTVRLTWDHRQFNEKERQHESSLLRMIAHLQEKGFFKSVKHSSSRSVQISMRPDVFELLRKQGNWLEYYIYSLLAREKVRRSIHDLELGITIEWEWQDAKTVNEADVIASLHRQLYFISCKSGKVKGDAGTTALDQLVSVAPRTGGLFTRKILVTIQELSMDMKARAELLKIHTVVLKELLLSEDPVATLLGQQLQ